MAWLRNWSRDDDPAVRLVCLPPAGGGAHLYRHWPRLLPAGVGLVAVELPGHGSRLGEAPFTDLTRLAEGPLCEEIEELLDRPLIIFGHSMGAVVGYELCRAIRRRRPWRPTGFVAAACEAPAVLHTRDYAGRMTDDGITRFLVDTGGTPAAILENEEFLDMLRPVIRADLGMLRARRHLPEEPLGCPVRVYLGATDTTIDPAKAAGWAVESGADGDYRLQVFPGGHFFTREAEPILLSRLKHDIRQLLSPTVHLEV
ncbi:alpha/beta fold hydrolase [Streptomyces sp. NPDC046862]|uniref:thioesterase II family protein n=1 Tax=Streptomyces sp. NPDC046862 TaxID=3154603 RepID=UPI003455132F